MVLNYFNSIIKKRNWNKIMETRREDRFLKPEKMKLILIRFNKKIVQNQGAINDNIAKCQLHSQKKKERERERDPM